MTDTFQGNLLQRILSKQPNISMLEAPCSGCRGQQVGWLMSDGWKDGMSDDTQTAFRAAAAEATEKWRNALTEAGKQVSFRPIRMPMLDMKLSSQMQNQVLMVRDHPFSSADPAVVLGVIHSASGQAMHPHDSGNFTSVPSSLLLHEGTVPVLTIRDPRLAITSAYRVLKDMGLPHGSGRPNFLISTSLQWQRLLYEFFTSHGITPLVVDGDDLMTSPQYARSLCEKLDLDPGHAYLSWPAASEEEKSAMHPMFLASQRKLIESDGLNPARAAKNVIDFKKEEQGWEQDFGEDLAMVKEMIALAMPHYEWFQAKRFRPE